MDAKIKALSIAFKKGTKGFKSFLKAVSHIQGSMSLFTLHIEHYNSLERDAIKLAHLTGDLDSAKERVAQLEQKAKDISRTTIHSFARVYKKLYEREYNRLAQGRAN
ncbi:hypothetical protein LCGC14_0957560 [marine sediment metagenome]|uniref:Uncharacterized protein n=1 Tax=marine sediment metagenome TaxID=412755 RepID=A0A0F9P1Q2_9ZZZZ